MLQKSRELTQKQTIESDSEEEEGTVPMEPEDEQLMSAMGNNPWMSAGSSRSTQLSRPENLMNADARDSEEDKAVNPEISDSDNSDAEQPVQNVRLQGNSHPEGSASESDESEDKIEEIFRPLDKDGKKRKKAQDEISHTSEIFKSKDSGMDRKTKAVKGKGKVSLGKRKQTTAEDESEGEEEEEGLIGEGLKRIKTLDDIEQGNFATEESFTEVKSKKKKMRESKVDESNPIDTSKEEVYVDPKKLFTVESKVRTSVPDVIEDGEEELDSEQQQRMTIAQAFEDDDVIDEFSQEKKQIEDRDKPKDIDLTLPGWGSWGGAGITVSQKKRKR